MIIKIEDGQAVGNPILEDNFRALHPGVAFPLVLTPAHVEPYGYGMYDFTQIPDIGPYQKLVEGAPVQNEYGIWRQQWLVEDLAGAELEERLAQIRAKRWDDIVHLRDSKAQNGGYIANGNWFHSDQKSQTQQLALARKADRAEALGGDMNVPFPGVTPGTSLIWKTMDDAWVPMTPALAQAIVAAAEAQDIALFAHSWALKLQMEASEDPAAFDITQGWPITFGAT